MQLSFSFPFRGKEKKYTTIGAEDVALTVTTGFSGNSA
jgi:hypothetical protein